MRAMSRHIDAAEVKHGGYWTVLAHGITLLNSDDLSLPLSYHLLQCSECKYVAIGAQIDKYEWCPYCGAKMDGGDDE